MSAKYVPPALRRAAAAAMDPRELELNRQIIDAIHTADDDSVDTLKALLGNQEMTKKVLNHPNEHGYTALHEVVALCPDTTEKKIDNRIKMLELLVRDGRVDVRATSVHGAHAFLMACRDKNKMWDPRILDVARIFHAYADEMTRAFGGSPDYRNPHCRCQPHQAVQLTPLHYAVEGGNLELVKYLVETCGCDVNVVTKAEVPGVEGGNNPLHYAYAVLNDGETQVKWDIIQYLIDHGCRQDVISARRYLPISKA